MDLMKRAFSLLKEKGIAIVNADDNELNKFFKTLNIILSLTVLISRPV